MSAEPSNAPVSDAAAQPAATPTKKKSKGAHQIVHEGEFDANNHYYPRVINASVCRQARAHTHTPQWQHYNTLQEYLFIA
jgi:hypothetical protein